MVDDRSDVHRGARARVEELRGYYTRLLIYAAVNLALLLFDLAEVAGGSAERRARQLVEIERDGGGRARGR